MSVASSAMSFAAIACTLAPSSTSSLAPLLGTRHGARAVRDAVGGVDQVLDGPHDETREREVREDEQGEREDGHVERDETRPAAGRDPRSASTLTRVTTTASPASETTWRDRPVAAAHGLDGLRRRALGARAHRGDVDGAPVARHESAVGARRRRWPRRRPSPRARRARVAPVLLEAGPGRCGRRTSADVRRDGAADRARRLLSRADDGRAREARHGEEERDERQQHQPRERQDDLQPEPRLEERPPRASGVWAATAQRSSRWRCAHTSDATEKSRPKVE